MATMDIPSNQGSDRTAIVVVDLGYGDQGKGTVTDYLVRSHNAHTVVRYNGGAQAGHNVVTADGRHHTFAQFGAGSFVPGVATVLTEAVAIQPWAMVVEAEHLARAGVPDAFERTVIADGAVVITPFHGAANRLRERARGPGRHGSCGVGVGEAVSDARTLAPELVVRAHELRDGGATMSMALRVKLRAIQEHKRAALAHVLRALHGDPGDREATEDRRCLEDPAIPGLYVDHLTAFIRRARIVDGDTLRVALDRPGAVVLEGAQGVLLDEWRGFHPYTTWSRCTDHPAMEFLTAHGWDGAVKRLGVVRAYATRHGAGPFVTEDGGLTARVTEPHNGTHPWQGDFRVGWFDAVATRYAVQVCERIDALAVTCLDRLHREPTWQLANGYAMDRVPVTDLPPGPWGDLAYQSALTERVLRASPVYTVTTEHADTAAHVAAIEDACGIPVTLVSTGPTADDKRGRAP